MASVEVDRIINALQELQKRHKTDLHKLRDKLAKALINEDTDLKQVGLKKQSEYNGYVAKGVYVGKPFPCSIHMSCSVPRCTQLILDFLVEFEREAKKVTCDWPKLVKYCLRELFTEVLPDELTKSLDFRRNHLLNLDVKGAEMLYANIKILRSSLSNTHFDKIQKDCKYSLDLSRRKEWKELVTESERIIALKKKSEINKVGKHLVKPTPPAPGRQHGQPKS